MAMPVATESVAAAFATCDPAEAAVRSMELLRCTHRMRLLERRTPFHARISYSCFAGVGLLSETYGSSVEIACEQPTRLVTVCFVQGRMHVERADGDSATAGGRTGYALAYDRPVRISWTPRAHQFMLSLDKARVEEFLRRLLCRPLDAPLRFEIGVDLHGTGQGVAAALDTVRHAIAACGKAGPPPVLAAEIEHSVLSALLFGQRHNYTDEIFSTAALPSPRVVREIVERVHAAPHERYSAADLAAIAGVSERSLYEAFRRQLGISPMAYVRQVRLDRAHEELLRLTPSGSVTVTDVALRHGFGHVGRFAAAYRARFGEPPSQTLRR